MVRAYRLGLGAGEAQHMRAGHFAGEGHLVDRSRVDVIGDDADLPQQIEPARRG